MSESAPTTTIERPTTTATATATIESPYLTPKEAAAYLKISLSTFRKVARLIKRCPQTRRYTREQLDAYAHSSRPRPTR